MRLAVLGLGKLGLPLSALLADVGHDVSAFDLSEMVRSSVRNRSPLFYEPGLSSLLEESSSRINVVDSIAEAVEQSDLALVIVPTPSDPAGRFSNTAVLECVRAIGQALRIRSSFYVVNIVSTVMPGSCENELIPELEKSSGKQIGKGVGLCYNPEFIALGSVIENMRRPDMHLLGVSDVQSGEIMESVLASLVASSVPLRRMNLAEAELVKLAVNNFVTMKISYANMLMQAAVGLGNVNVDVVTDAIGLDSRVGHRYLKAGAPFGGPCFPRDTRALTTLLTDLGSASALPRSVDATNLHHLQFIADQVARLPSVKGSVGIIGISYKPDTAVVEESPSIALIRMLESTGCYVQCWDPQFQGMEAANYASSLDELINHTDRLVLMRPLTDAPQLHEKLSRWDGYILDIWRQLPAFPMGSKARLVPLGGGAQ